MTSRTRTALTTGMAGLLAWLAGCSDRVGPNQPPHPERPPLSLVILSDPAVGSTAAAGAFGTPAATAEGVAYLSLPPGAVPGGTRAVIRNLGTGRAVTAALVDGGLDPVPVPAVA